MRQLWIACLAGAGLALCGGCDAPLSVPAQTRAVSSAPPPPPPPPPPAAPASEQPVAADPPAELPPSPAVEASSAIPASEPPPQTPQPETPQVAQSPIRLSAGVAVPQLLPEGTQIGVSVDYRVLGRINTSSRYLLVIESKGKPVEFEVQLTPAGGTLQGFCPATVRPEDQPFRARLDEQRSANARERVSNTANLQTSF